MSRRLLVAVVALSCAFVGAPAEASRAVNQVYAVPSDGVLRLTGHGFGHGHGMSQYGARGAAQQGFSHARILAFYYPGTTLTTTAGGIRVKLSGATQNSLVVANAAGMRVRSAGSTTSYPISGGTQWRLRKSGANTVLDAYNGSWVAVRTLPGAAELYGPSSLGVRLSGKTRAYRGAMRLTSDGLTVNVLGVDDYVRGVVAREMPASWHADAVRAQAVAARTYGAFERAANASRTYDICDTTSCQVYGGVGDEDSRSNAAVTATAGQVLTYGGAPAFTQFSSSSGGWTSAGSRPYLVAKADPYDALAGNPVHTWTKTLTRAAVQKAYPGLGTLTGVVVTRRDGNGDWAGRVESLVLDGSKKNVTVSGNAFRSTFGLRSAWFAFGAATSTAAVSTPISVRWKELGGYRSFLGGPRTAERAVGAGKMRIFKHGRIYWTSATGAHALNRRVAKAYVRKGVTRLGFPTTDSYRVGRKSRAVFEHGILTVKRSGKANVVWR